jgi:hypothetical protein
MKPTSLEFLAPGRRVNVVADIVLALRKSGAFASRKMWRHAVVEIRDGRARATSRGDFAMWLRSAADLRNEASECLKVDVPKGHVLVWLECDRPEGACAEFVLVDLVSECRAAMASRAA